MPFYPQAISGTVSIGRTLPPPEILHVEGGVFATGSPVLNQQWHDCPPRLARVDSFSIAPTCVTVGLQKQVMEGVEDKAPNNYPGIFSFDDNETFCTRLSAMIGKPYGIGTEVEWEYAARDRIDNVRQWMEQHPKLGLKTISDLRTWLVEGNGWLENCVVLGRGETLTLGSRLMADPTTSDFVSTLKSAAQIVAWTVFSGDGDLTHEAFYFGQQGRGPVKYGKLNQKGVWDMTGGMWEWCAYYFGQKNLDNCSVRVRRGGSSIGNDRAFLRLAHRTYAARDERKNHFGARLFGPAQGLKVA